MKALTALLVLCASFAVVGAFVYPPDQDEDRALDGPALKAMITNLGFTTKDLEPDPEKLKFEFTVTKASLDVPIACEVSASKRFVWLTVFLGEVSKFADLPARSEKLLRQNFKVQPCQFYITERGNLMLAIALDNRNLTSAILRHRIDKLSDDVVSSEEAWKPE